MSARHRATVPTTTWTLDGHSARTVGGEVALDEPTSGLRTSTDDMLLGLDLRIASGGPRLVDHWVRGEDLVAVYEPTDPRRLRATAMWRRHDRRETAVELVVSSQTSLTESDSSVAVVCDLAGGTIHWATQRPGDPTAITDWQPLTAASSCPAEATCLLVKRPADTVLVAVHPADARRVTVRATHDRVVVSCWLFSTAIEKGVLLRSRVLAATGPVTDTAWATSMAADFLASPPPLTA